MDAGQTIYNTARAAGFPSALSAFMVAQARFETANFTSSVYLKCLNCFGYKATGSAPKCTLSPESDYYKKYGSIAESTNEVVAWIRRRQGEGKFPKDLTTIATVDQYAALLKTSGYYGDSVANYTAGLKRYYKEYKTPPGSTGLLMIALLTALLITRR